MGIYSPERSPESLSGTKINCNGVSQMIKYTVKPVTGQSRAGLCDITGRPVTGRKDQCVRKKV